MEPEHSWGHQTELAIANFPVSGQRIPIQVIRVLARMKQAAAVVNEGLGVIERGTSDAITAAAQDVIDGRCDDQFPIDVYQTGSGTSTNMNVNEVVASLAGDRLGVPVHPNDAVNASQSSNDVFPSAVHIAVQQLIVDRLVPSLEGLADSLRRGATRFDGVVKAARTHLMDAVPITLGDEFGGYASLIERQVRRLVRDTDELLELPLGGTAVGTGLNAPDGFASGVIEAIGGGFREVGDHHAIHGNADAMVATSAALRTAALALHKIAGDLRWMSSGPACGLGEISLPELQPGSSIMPGKVNPVICEAVHQVVARVVGNDATVAFAAAAGSQFELNTMWPVMATVMIESVGLLANVSTLLAERCVDGIEADVEACRRYAESTPAIATALNGTIGYEAGAAVVKEALTSGRTIRQVVLDKGLLPAEALDELLDVDAMARGG